MDKEGIIPTNLTTSIARRGYPAAGAGERRRGRLTRTARLLLITAAIVRQIRHRHRSSARCSRRPRAPPKVPPHHHGWTPVRPAFPPRAGMLSSHAAAATS